MVVRGVRSFVAAVVGAAVATSRTRTPEDDRPAPRDRGEPRTVLQTAGRVALRSLQVLAGAMTSLGSGGVVPPGQPPTTATKKLDEYRP